MNMLLAQFVDLVSQVYAYLQTHQGVYLKPTAICVLFASQRHWESGDKMLRVWLQAPGGCILWFYPAEPFCGCYSSSAFGLSYSPWSSRITPESFALSSAVALSHIPFWLLPLGLGCMWTQYTWDRVHKYRVEPEWKLFLMSQPVSASLLLWFFWSQGRQSWDKCPPILCPPFSSFF